MKTLGPNPTLARLEYRPSPQRDGESDTNFWRRVARTARRQLKRLLGMADYRYSHQSFAVRDALLLAEAICETPTYGVEQIERGKGHGSPAITYLNAGDPYLTTAAYINGRFCVVNWGSIVERGSYS